MKTMRAWMILLGLSLASVNVAATHTDNGCDDSCIETPFAGLAQELRAYRAKIGELDRIILDMQHETYEMQVLIQECRVMLRPDDDEILCRQFILDAIDIKETILHIKFEDLRALLAEIVEEEGTILGLIEGLIEAGECPTEELCLKLIRKVQGIEKLTLEISNITEAQQDRLEDGDAGEEECEEVGPNCFDDVDDFLEAAFDIILDDRIGAKFLLGQAYAKLREFQRVNRTIFKKKKEVFKRLSEVQSLVKSAVGSLRTWRSRALVGDGPASPARVQLVDASGRVVLQSLLGSVRPLTLRALALSQGLPNGVYWAMVTGRGKGGAVHREVHQLVVLR